MPFYAQHVRQAQTYLKKNDPRLRDLIRDVGPFTLKAQRHAFHMLVKSIISQQISTSAARTITDRLLEHVGMDPILPQAFDCLDIEILRTIGVSQQKASYLLDLAAKATSGELQLENISRKSDNEIIAQLTQVKGIGVWTAHMFLIFSLARMDVLPTGDLGIKTAIQNIYGLEELPEPQQIEAIAVPWRPYASIASWYLWQSLEKNS